MAIATFIVGAYGATYNSVALGLTDDGYELQFEPKRDLINKSDVYGDKLLDMIYRGTDWMFQTDFKEWKAGPVNISYPWSSLGEEGTIGVLDSSVAEALVLTAAAGTTAAGAAAPNIATLTANLTILAPNSNPRAQFNSRLRTLPVRLVMLPYNSSGVTYHFITTT